MGFLPYAVAGWLFVVGLYGVVTSRNLVHLIVSLTVSASTHVLLMAIGYRPGGMAPVITHVPASPSPVCDEIESALSTSI